jgi:hypothetical protein
MAAQKIFVALVPALFIFTLTLFGPSLIADGDPYWHIKAGEWMLEHGAILHTDPFSFTFAGRPWIAHEWLSEILMASTYWLFGWKGLYVLFGSIFALTAFLLAQTLLRDLEPVPAFYVLAFALADLKAGSQCGPTSWCCPFWLFGPARF